MLFMMRTALVLNIFLHEYFHILAAVLFCNKFFPVPSELGANKLCNVKWQVWLAVLVPFSSWPDVAAAPHVCFPTAAIKGIGYVCCAPVYVCEQF